MSSLGLQTLGANNRSIPRTHYAVKIQYRNTANFFPLIRQYRTKITPDTTTPQTPNYPLPHSYSLKVICGSGGQQCQPRCRISFMNHSPYSLHTSAREDSVVLLGWNEINMLFNLLRVVARGRTVHFVFITKIILTVLAQLSKPLNINFTFYEDTIEQRGRVS